MSIPISIDYTVQIWKEGPHFIAHAMPLDVMSQGSSPDAARKALEEAVHVFLATAADLGTLDEVLQESGYARDGEKWASPAWVSVEQHSSVVGD